MPDLVRSRCAVWRPKGPLYWRCFSDDGPPQREDVCQNYHEWSDRRGGLTKGAHCIHCGNTLAETMRQADEVYGVEDGSDEHLARALRTGA